ncbi:hypothetical protein V8E36_005465 [Tilletia maclaganii]
MAAFKRNSEIRDDSSWHKGQSWQRRRLRRILVVVIILLVLLGIGVGVGLGIGLRKPDRTRKHVQASTFPTDGLDLSAASLKSRGFFYTDSSPSGSAVFNWTAGGFTFKTWSNSTDDADIVLNTTIALQQIDGFGAGLTDSAAYVLYQLKQGNQSLYDSTLQALFNIRTGLPILRIPLGACDFSLGEYSYAPNPPPGDLLSQALSRGNATSALQSAGFGLGPSNDYVIPVMRDILAIRPSLKVMFSPWSPPPWTKTNGTYNGGSIIDGFVPLVAQYYVMAIRAFVDAGVPAWAMTVQNEPSFAAKYPSTIVDSATQSDLASAVRALLPRYNLTGLKIFAHDNNFARWQDAADIVNLNSSAIDGIAWHAYKGDLSQISNYRNNLTQADLSRLETHMTEFTGTTSPGKKAWDSISYWLQNIYFPMLNQFARSVESWNLALDPNFGPRLASAYCDNCLGTLKISTPEHFADPWVETEAQFVTASHFNAATVDLSISNGGGPTFRAFSYQRPNATGSTANLTCITSQGFAAPLNGTELVPSNARNTNTVYSRRASLIVWNSCNTSQSLGLNIDGRATTFTAGPGVSTLVWEAP